MVSKKVVEDEEGSTKRKTPHQLQTLENLYSEDRYPSHETMEDLGISLKLTYKQVRGWFVERRRREKREIIAGTDTPAQRYKDRGNDLKDLPRHLNSSIMRGKKSKVRQNSGPFKRRSKLSLDLILKKVFRKDGPPLGVKFDTLPSGAFQHKTAGPMRGPTCERGRTGTKKRKVLSSLVPELEVNTNKSVSMTKHGMGKGLMTVWNATNPGAGSCPTSLNSIGRDVADMDNNSTLAKSTKSLRRKMKKSHQKLAMVLSSPVPEFEFNTEKSVSVKKHGMGKGLMTVWRATNPGARSYPSGLNSTGRDISDMDIDSAVGRSTRPLRRKKKKSHQKMMPTKQASRKGYMKNKLPEKKKRPIRSTRVSSNKSKYPVKQHQEECRLALEGLRCQEYSNSNSKSVDDEELELRELQAGPNPMTCSTHLAFNGMHSCPLCKDLLARFPPHSVKMRQPLCMQPWVSSPELVKKLFKIFSFLYGHSEIFDICSFTLDEFAQAFHDKDSKLLGRIHMALLKVLFSDLETEFSGEYHPHASKNYRYMGFVHSVKRQQFILSMWNRYLNSVTWTEILRQVLIAAGFNTKPNNSRGEDLSKDDKHLAECGLRPGTLKGEVFSILTEQGSNGLKVSELAKSLRVVDLHLTDTTEELELLIYSTLSSDITLFEKISPSAYRLRRNSLTSKGEGNIQSDSENSGSVDVPCGDSISSSDESELDSARTNNSIIKCRRMSTKKTITIFDDTEIDESNSGELWLLALMEGEYSGLSLDEKLTTLVALADLTSAGSSIRVETPASFITENSAIVPQHGGAKIKRALGKDNTLFWENSIPQDLPLKHRMKWNGFTRKSDIWGSERFISKDPEGKDVESHGHSLHSIYLGSDRRFNSYWLFLGPCDAKDPGHKRVYFESSEDGHWEVIDTKEGLSSLLSVLDGRGSREARLLSTLTRLEAYLSEEMSTNLTSDSDMRQSTQSDQSCIDAISGDGSSPISDVDNIRTCIETVNERVPPSEVMCVELKKVEQEQNWERLQAFDAWIWHSFYSNLNAVKHNQRSYLDTFVRCTSCHDLYWRDEKHCKICHTTFELDFDLEQRYAMHVATCRENEDNNIFPKHRVLSTQLQTLKAALHAVEGAMPKEALVSAWTTSDHRLWATRLKRTASLSELLQVLTDFVGAINEDWLHKGVSCETAPDEMIQSFTTMPQTTSAVALWLVRLDEFIAPHLIKSHPGKAAETTTTRQKRKLAQV